LIESATITKNMKKQVVINNNEQLMK